MSVEEQRREFEKWEEIKKYHMLCRDYYALKHGKGEAPIYIGDASPSQEGMFERLLEYNRKGYGIFETVAEFNGNPRRKHNVVTVGTWSVDIDDGTKQAQRQDLSRGPAVPTFTVLTKRGYQAHWVAKDEEGFTFEDIVMDRLVPFYGADSGAKDICRILRVPGFFHLKDPKDPFLVKVVLWSKVEYTTREMLHLFPAEKKVKQKRVSSGNNSFKSSDPFWGALSRCDQQGLLEKFSGHEMVDHETFEFTENASGTKNIVVNGEPTGCWIDLNQMIGTNSGGGAPTIYQWLMYYDKNKNRGRECVEQIAEMEPMLKKYLTSRPTLTKSKQPLEKKPKEVSSDSKKMQQTSFLSE